MGKAVTLAIVLIWTQLCSAADAVDVEAPVVRLQLYKNGLAVVHHAFDIPGPGAYRLTDVPAARHGTFWVESDARIITRTTTEEIEEPVEGPLSWPDYTGQLVHVLLRDGNSAHGTLESVTTRPHDNGNVPVSGTVVLSSDEQDYVIAFQDVIMFRIRHTDDEAPITGTRTAQRDVMEFTALDVPEGGGKVVFSYLTQGLTWMPSYRLVRDGDGGLVITQAAIVKNDWADFDTTLLEAISGFPNLEFADVLSPMTGGTNIANFLNQVNQAANARVPFFLDNGAITQQAVTSNRMDVSFAPPTAPVEGESDAVDLHLQELGAFAMKRGDALSLDTLHGDTTYTDKVRWVVRPAGDQQGRVSGIVPPTWRNRVGDPWDMVVFKNPFGQPLTTAPALVVEDGQLRGQSTLYWTNPKGEAELPYTKALSIETRHNEYEDPSARKEVVVFKQNRAELTFSGAIEVVNRRAEAVEIEIVHYVEGTVSDAGSADVQALPQHATRFNSYQSLTWNLNLEPNTPVELEYAYTRVE